VNTGRSFENSRKPSSSKPSRLRKLSIRSSCSVRVANVGLALELEDALGLVLDGFERPELGGLWYGEPPGAKDSLGEAAGKGRQCAVDHRVPYDVRICAVATAIQPSISLAFAQPGRCLGVVGGRAKGSARSVLVALVPLPRTGFAKLSHPRFFRTSGAWPHCLP
jgi:hypothetical protein